MHMAQVRLKIITLARYGQGRFRATEQTKNAEGVWCTTWKCVHMTAGYSGHQTKETARRCYDRHTLALALAQEN